jgi:ribosomal protein L27
MSDSLRVQITSVPSSTEKSMTSFLKINKKLFFLIALLAVFAPLNLNGQNNDPVFTSTPVTTVADDQSYEYIIQTSDPQGKKVTISSQLPSWLGFSDVYKVTTLAGGLSQGYNDGTGTSAQFFYPRALALDPDGNLFIVESGGHVIRKMTPEGVVSTFAGLGNSGGYVEGTGTDARFYAPEGITIDAAGNLYIADGGNNRVRKITPAGVVTTLAGSGQATYADGIGTNASFWGLRTITSDDSGNLYVGQGNFLKKITPEGVVTTFLDGFQQIHGLAFNDGHIYVNDYLKKIYKVTLAGVSTIFAGSDTEGNVDGTGTEAQFQALRKMTFDENGNLFVPTSESRTIRKVSPQGVVSTVLGVPQNGGFVDGIGADARLTNPFAMQYDPNRKIFYLADLHSIRKITIPTKLFGDASGQKGDHNIDLLATDGDGGTANQTFTISVTGTPSTAIIARKTPLDAATALNSVSFQITFNEDVQNIDKSDFELSGTATGTIGDLIATTGSSVFEIPVTGIAGFGELSLGFAAGQNITDGYTDFEGSITSAETYTITETTVAIKRDTPSEEVTRVTSLKFLLTFDEAVQHIDKTDFELAGTATATIGDLIEITAGTVFQVPVMVTSVGTVDLNFSSNQDISDGLNSFVATNITEEESFTVLPNAAPVFTTTPTITVDSETTYSYNFNVTDADGDDPTITTPTLPSWLSLSVGAAGLGNEVTTFAGSGTVGDTNGTGTSASFGAPFGIAQDAAGNTYISITADAKIKKITPAGVVSDFVTTGLSEPRGLTFDNNGNLYVAGLNAIFKVTPAGVVSSFADLTYAGYANNVVFEAGSDNDNFILHVSYMRSGLYGDYENVTVTPSFVRSGNRNSLSENGGKGLAISSLGNVYLPTNTSFRIYERYQDSRGRIRFRIYLTLDQTPSSIVIDSNDNMYVGTESNNILKITPDKTVTTIFGTGAAGSVDGEGTSASFNGINELFLNDKDELYIADAGNFKLRKVPATGGPSLTGTSPAGGTHDVVLRADDGFGGIVDQSFTITVIDNTDPVFTSATTATFAENGTGTAYTVEATDANAITYSLGTGNDEALFDFAAGLVTFKTAPDFENPTDSNTDNAYVINVIATDASNNASNQDVTITVTDVVAEDVTPPVFTSLTTASFAENGTGTAYTITATDANAITYSLGTGNDEALFDITAGVVTFKTAPDFENPADGNTDNTYVINVIASDGINEVNQDVTITVTDVDEIDPVFTSLTTASFAENGTGTAYTIVATDANAITYSLGTGNDEALFDIAAGAVTFKNAPDFENPADGHTDNAYVINVVASDGINEVNQDVTITVTDVDDTDPVFTSLTTATFAENGTGTAYTITATDANAITYSLGTGNDEALFNIAAGLVTFKTSPDFEIPTDGNTDNAYVINVIASDGINEVNQDVTIMVIDADEINPVFTSSASVNFAENTVGVAYTVVATDANTVTYSLGTGNDVASFNINANTGAVTFKALPNFEVPRDANTDNAYVIEVKASDGINEATTTVTITVTDVYEDPAKLNLVSSTPLDGAVNFTGTTITLIFDRNAVKGSGAISVKDASDDTDLFVKGINHPDISINGTMVVIDMKTPLPNDKEVYLSIPATAFKDLNNVFFPGIADKTTLNFFTPSTPQLVSSTPTDDATNFGGTTVSMTFDRSMVKGTGSVSLKDASNDTDIWSVGITHPSVSINGSTVTLNVGVLPLDKEFYVQITPTALKDVNDLFYRGISDKTTLNFFGKTTPLLIASTPTDDAANYNGTTITLTFDRIVLKGVGVLTLFDASNDAQVWSVGINHPDVSINGSTVTLNVGDLPVNKQFYLNVAATAFKDAQNNFYKGISDQTTLNFSGMTAPVLVASTPSDDATGYGGTTVTLTFDRTLIKGTGLISLKNAANDADIWSVGVNHPDVVINGSTVTLNVGQLPIEIDFYVNIGDKVFKDVSNLFYKGITDKTTLNFTGITTPRLISSNPIDGSTGFIGSSIVLTFDRDVIKGAGVLTLFDAADDGQLWSKGINNASITISGSVVTLNTGLLAQDKSVYLNIAATAFKDATNLFYAGITDKTTLNFSTQSSGGGSPAPFQLGEEVIVMDTKAFSIYPNPATNEVTINLSKVGEAPTVIITNLSGMEMYRNAKVETEQLTIDVNSYSQGVFLITVTTDSGEVIRKKMSVIR